LTPDLIDRLGQAATECRAAIREAHEASQDLRALLKEARDLHAKTLGDVRAEMTAGVDIFREVNRVKTQEAARVVVDSFENLSYPLLDALVRLERRAAWVGRALGLPVEGDPVMGPFLKGGPSIGVDPLPWARDNIEHPERWPRKEYPEVDRLDRAKEAP
jgi:hypothetical protein